MSREITLLEGEEFVKKLKPRFLSFFHLYILSLILIIAGLIMVSLFKSAWWDDNVVGRFGGVSIGPVETEATAGVFVWAALLLVIGFMGRHFWLDKGGRKLFFINLIIVILGIAGLVLYGRAYGSDKVNDIYHIFLPAINIGIGVLGFIAIDYYRRGFHYTLTNLRLVISRHFFSIDQRVVRYSHIEDISVQQGVIGRLFNYGTVIPITGSGLGTGSDQSIAFAAASTEIAGMNLGAGGGSKKSVTTSKAMPEECLFGIKNPIQIRELLSKYINEQSQVTQVSRQRDTLENIEQLLRQQANQAQQPQEKNS